MSQPIFVIEKRDPMWFTGHLSSTDTADPYQTWTLVPEAGYFADAADATRACAELNLRHNEDDRRHFQNRYDKLHEQAMGRWREQGEQGPQPRRSIAPLPDAQPHRVATIQPAPAMSAV